MNVINPEGKNTHTTKTTPTILPLISWYSQCLSTHDYISAMIQPYPNPTLLAIVSLEEWKAFQQQCDTDPKVSQAFPSLTMKVEGRSLDLFLALGLHDEKPEQIGILYMESHNESTTKELEDAIADGRMHPKALQSLPLMEGGQPIVVYFEWFEDVTEFTSHEWGAITKLLQHRFEIVSTISS